MADDHFSGGGGCREMKSFVLNLLMGRWFMFFASLLILSASGATYIFGMYSNVIKTSMGYDQTTLNLVGFSKDLGFGIISGLLNEITPPWFILLVGAIMNFFGYFMIWLAVTGRTHKPHVWQMCVYICLGSNSQGFANTGALVTCVKNFPESRGSVLGLLKSLVGLSGAILTQLYHAFYGENPAALILLIAWLPTAVSFVFLPVVRFMKIVHQKNELKAFFRMFYMTLGFAVFIMVLIILQNRLQFNRLEYIGSASVVTVLLFLPLIVIIREEFKIWKSQKQALENNASEMKVVTESPPIPAVESVQPQPAGGDQKQVGCLENIFKPPDRGEDYTILQAVFSIDMLVLFIATTCGLGGTMAAIDNLGQIGESLGYPNRNITTFVSLVSIWSCLGRLIAGFASEYLLNKYKMPRPLLLTFVILLSNVGHLLIAFAVPNSIYFASVIVGFCFGAQLPLMFAIVSEIFGLKYYATLYNIGSLASPFGSYIFNVKIAGNLYDGEAMKQMKALGRTRKAGEELNCTGGQCFRLAFLIITAITLFGFLVSCILVFRTRKFYKSDIYKKFREEVMAEEIDMGSTSKKVESKATDKDAVTSTTTASV